MEYAYANVKHQQGRWIAEPHTAVDGNGFVIPDEQAERLELREAGQYVFLVKFVKDDQFASIITLEQVAELAAAAATLVFTINSTGGIYQDRKGLDVPVEDPEWHDLADAYNKACNGLGVDPLRDEELEVEAKAEREDDGRDWHEKRVQSELDEMYPDEGKE